MSVKRLLIWYRVLYSLFSTFFGVRCNVLSAKESVKKINSGKSFIRFGDGEFGIYQGHGVHYQEYSDELRNEFLKIKNTFEHSGENCPFLLAVPKRYMQCSGITLCKKRVLVSSWAESRRYFKKNFDRTLIYGDAFLFELNNKEIYKDLWNEKSEKKTIIFVHNNIKYAKAFANTYNYNVEFVPCAVKNSYCILDSIVDNIFSVIKKNNLNKNNVQMVISAGPAGKILAYRLAMQGYHCIDAGHCWDDPLTID